MKSPVSKRTVFGVVGLALAFFLLGASVVYAQLPISQTHIISGGIDLPSTYTVWTNNDGMYYAKTTYGALAFSGSNFVALMEDVLDAMTIGGKITFLEGTYYFDSVLVIDIPKIILEGQGKATEFAAHNDIDQLINISSPLAPGSYTDKITIRDIAFYNPFYATFNLTAINIAIDQGIVWNVNIKDCYFVLINAVWTTDTAAPECLNHGVFENLHVDFPPDYAFKIYDSIDLSFNDIYIQFGTYKVGNYGIYLWPAVSSGIQISNVRIFHPEYGIYLYYASNTRVQNSIVDFAANAYYIRDSSQCTFINNYAHAPSGGGKGFYITGASNNTRFIGNDANMCFGGGFEDASAPDGNTTYIGNDAYLSTPMYTVDVASDIARGNFNLTDFG